jgi:hypothetical protein
MSLIQVVKPKSAPQKATQTTLDTKAITRDIVKTWRHPPFQRPLRENEKVRQCADQIDADGGVIPGIITLGVLDGNVYVVDGQHRVHGFTISKTETAYVDVRTHFFETMAEMGAEYVRLNSSLVKMRPDDILRGLEASLPALQRLRKKCPFVGYDMIRRNERSPILSVSAILRVWIGSRQDVPSSTGSSAQSIATDAFTDDEADLCVDFLTLCLEAWGRDPEYARLWSSLNLIICAWLYRRLVLGHGASALAVRLTREQFRKCLMTLSADGAYIDWLLGRQLGERDRSPAYHRIRNNFVKRIESDTGRKPKLPAPAWATHQGGRK